MGHHQWGAHKRTHNASSCYCYWRLHRIHRITSLTLLQRALSSWKSLSHRAKWMCPPSCKLLHWSSTAIHEWHPCWAPGPWSSSPELQWAPVTGSSPMSKARGVGHVCGNKQTVFGRRVMRLARPSDARFVTQAEELWSLVLEKKAPKSPGKSKETGLMEDLSYRSSFR